MATWPMSSPGPSLARTTSSSLDALFARGKADPTAIHTMHCRKVAPGGSHQFTDILDLEPDWGSEATPAWDTGKLKAIHVSPQLVAEAAEEILSPLTQQTTLCSPLAETLPNPVYLDALLDTRAPLTPAAQRAA